MTAHLATERLALRPITPDLLPRFDYFAEAEWRRFLGEGFPTAARFIANNAGADWEEELNFAIFSDGTLLGSVHLGLGIPSGVGELACLLSPRCWGRGIAHEACVAVLDYAFRERGLFKAYARVDARHARSVRVLEKLGMTVEAVLRQHRLDSDGARADELWYGILVGEWRARETRGAVSVPRTRADSIQAGPAQYPDT